MKRVSLAISTISMISFRLCISYKSRRAVKTETRDLVPPLPVGSTSCLCRLCFRFWASVCLAQAALGGFFLAEKLKGT